jgi:signal transduction histidine kinase
MQKKNRMFPRKSPDRLFAAVAGIGYLLLGLVWVGISDQVGGLLFSTPEALTRYQTYKGGAFIVGSALLVFLLAARGADSGDTPAGSRSGVGLSALLALLVLVTSVPLVALLGYNIQRQTRTSVAEANALVQGVARARVAAMLAFLEERRRLAQLLARRPLGARPDSRECDLLLGEMMSLHEEIGNIVVLDAGGDPTCTAGAGPHVRVTAAQWKGQGVLVGTPLLAAPGHLLPVSYPIRAGGGQVVGALQLLLPLSALQRIVAGEPRGVTSSLISLDGYLLARSPLAPQRLGKKVPELAPFAAAARRGETSQVARGVDGVERFYALQPVGGTGLVAVAGLEVNATYGPLRESALRALGAAGAVLLAAGLLISALARRITAPMRALAQTADAVAAGQFARRAPELGPREIAGVAAVFNRMLDRLPVLERQLRDSEERHRTLLAKLSQNIPGMIFQMRMERDGHTTLPFVSEAIVRMFDVPPEAAAVDAGGVLARIHPDDAQAVTAALCTSAETLGYLALQYRVLLHAQAPRHYLTYGRPERLADGAVLWHGCTVDVTQLEEARLALRHANDSLELRVAERTQALAAANESLESFSYSVAHDLRAPLQAIEGFSGALPAALARPDPERVARLADRIVANTGQMGRMIDGLLAVAGAGKGELQEQSLPLDALVRGVLAELPVPASTELRVAPLPTVRADAATLRQVWWNLLANAVKFTGREPAGRIVVDWEQQGAELVFAVRDNGAGFDPQFAGRLFSAFQRLHDAGEFEGTGIGLALARRVVERHGGRIWAEGEIGRGATFRFSLPASRLIS